MILQVGFQTLDPVGYVATPKRPKVCNESPILKPDLKAYSTHSPILNPKTPYRSKQFKAPKKYELHGPSVFQSQFASVP